MSKHQEVSDGTEAFPTLVYKNNGPHQRAGGTYDYKAIADQEDLDEALSDGWYKTLPDAIGTKPVVKTPESTAAPTLDELKIKATELKIQFPANVSHKKLAELVDAELAKQAK